MTAKVYELFKGLEPRIVAYKQIRANPDDPNAKVKVGFACSKERENDLENFVKNCNESDNEDVAKIIAYTDGAILFEVISDYGFSESIIRDIL